MRATGSTLAPSGGRVETLGRGVGRTMGEEESLGEWVVGLVLLVLLPPGDVEADVVS